MLNQISSRYSVEVHRVAIQENAGDLGRKREGKGGEEEKERENFEDSFILIPSHNCQHNVY